MIASVRMIAPAPRFQAGRRVNVAIWRRSRAAVRRQRAHPGGVTPDLRTRGHSRDIIGWMKSSNARRWGTHYGFRTSLILKAER